MIHVCKKTNSIFDDVLKDKIKIDVFKKGDNDKFTNVDWMIQKMLENYMNEYFPQVKIIGEEDTSKIINCDSNYLTLDSIVNSDFIKKEDIEPNSQSINAEELCIYVDPIDSTSNFIKKIFNPVTVLIGITKLNKPFIGIVHFPSKNGESISYFNLPGRGIFSYNFKNDDIKKEEYKLNNEWKFISSNTRTTDKMNNSYF